MRLNKGVYVIKMQQWHLVTVMEGRQHWFTLTNNTVKCSIVVNNTEMPWDKDIVTVTKIEQL
jgi:hypothetical protein